MGITVGAYGGPATVSTHIFSSSVETYGRASAILTLRFPSTMGTDGRPAALFALVLELPVRAFAFTSRSSGGGSGWMRGVIGNSHPFSGINLRRFH